MAETIPKEQSDITEDTETFEESLRKDESARRSSGYLAKKPHNLEKVVCNFRANHRKQQRLLDPEDPYLAI